MKKITLLLTEIANLLTSDSMRWQFLTRINLLLAFMTTLYGTGFYLYTHDLRGLVPNLIEALLFIIIATINQFRLHFMAAHLTVLVSNLTIVYYSALLGSIVEVHLLVIFYVGLAFYLFRDNITHCAISVSITAFAWICCEVTYYLEWVHPIEISRDHLFATRWLAIPFILILDILMISLHIYIIWRQLKSRTQKFAESSHELRNAFQLILSIIEKERRDGHNSPQMDEIYRSALFVRQLVTSELDTAKIEAGQEDQITLHSVEIKPFLDSIVAQNRFLAADKNVTIDYSCKMPTYILTDQPAIIKIVNNLLSNAIKFTPIGSTVSVQIFYSEERWQINVTDQGPGIDQTLLPKIYAPYVSKGGSLEGTGLGLFITRKLVRQLRGSISLTPFDGGTKATIILPLKIGTPPNAHSPIWDRQPLGGKTVLIIEDNEMMLTLTGRFMEQAGAATLLARDALVGYELAQRHIPDAIILDLETSDKISGPAAIRMFKSYVPLQKVPIIVLTGATMKETLAQATNAGAAKCFSKPLPYSDVLIFMRDLFPKNAAIES
ncbi:hybrid sensor histidine kinase/response regulator [Chitinophaga lutea]|uniref:histidine kinase n=1 Tax=Chitinophaga lutea TaxID=2488634 RepID=A0A3N4PWL4_9BACT|nr:hybrid sensor histidine kinase/response regulator [Chitinophaga lutea]RPE13203.1 hybrid sensor histidine kinase/response regulator [Chitinophaga lutea]